MKFSLFNVWALVEENLLLFNTQTGALAEFEPQHRELVLQSLESQNIKYIPAAFLDEMIEDGYLVDVGQDELDCIRSARLDRLSRTDEYQLCITLNKKCNFSCGYCFQNHSGLELSRNGTSQITRMFDTISLKAKSIEVDWFGGEPLLSLRTMQILNNSFSALSRERGVAYGYTVTTNGYLLNDDMICYLRQMKPLRLTITLDGPPDVHDLSRPLRGGRGTFWVILSNIKKAVAAGLTVDVRVNISTLNADRISELYDILEEHRLKNAVSVNLQGVVSSKANPYEEYCLTGKTLAHSILSTYRTAAKKGWVVFPSTDNLRVLGFCIGEYPNRIVTDLDGNVFRCTQMAEDDAVGKIQNDGQVEIYRDKDVCWSEKNPLSFVECRTCPFLPLCMGGCNLQRARGNGDNHCLGWKRDVQTFLEVLIANQENLSLQRTV